tara:strand:- start:5610 stop:6035 length:426 start_codon:yes stop_codon:yes gene_type:complete
VIGLPGSRWRGEAFAVEPFQLPAGYVAQLEGRKQGVCSGDSKPRHPMHYAQRWSKELEDTPGLTVAQVAEREGLSRKQVRSVLRLRRFPADIQKALANLSDPGEIDFYRERRLRHLTHLNASEQLAGFAKLQQRWEAQNRQ